MAAGIYTGLRYGMLTTEVREQPEMKKLFCVPVLCMAVDALSPANRERVRIASIDGVRRADIRQIRTDVVYATARRLA